MVTNYQIDSSRLCAARSTREADGVKHLPLLVGFHSGTHRRPLMAAIVE